MSLGRSEIARPVVATSVGTLVLVKRPLAGIEEAEGRAPRLVGVADDDALGHVDHVVELEPVRGDDGRAVRALLLEDERAVTREERATARADRHGQNARGSPSHRAQCSARPPDGLETER